MRNKVVWVDLETGGLDPSRHQVTQVAAIATTATPELEEIDEFEMKVQLVDGHYDTEALAVNSYDAETWAKEGMPSVQVVYHFKRFLELHATFDRRSKRGRTYSVAFLAGHNLEFDCKFLRAMFKRNNDTWLPASAWTGGYLDTLQLARWLDLKRAGKWLDHVRLEDCCKLFDIKSGEHDALGDVRASINFARAALAELSQGRLFDGTEGL